MDDFILFTHKFDCISKCCKKSDFCFTFLCVFSAQSHSLTPQLFREENHHRSAAPLLGSKVNMKNNPPEGSSQKFAGAI